MSSNFVDVSQYLEPVFDQLDKENIKYCLYRSFQDLPKRMIGSDIDLIVSRRDKDRFITILREHGFEGTRNAFFLYIPTKDYWIVVSAQSKITTRGFFLSGESIIGHRRKFKNMYVLVPEYEFVLLLASSAASKKVSSHRKERLNTLKDIQLNEKLLDRAVRDIFPEIDGLDLSEIVSANFSVNMIVNSRKGLRRINFNSNQTNRSDFLVRSAKKFYSLSKKSYSMLRKLLPGGKDSQSGLILAFIGLDGAGKTTLINNLFPEGVEKRIQLNKSSMRVGSMKFSGSKIMKKMRKSIQPVSLLGWSIFLVLNYIESIALYYKAHRQKRKGNIVVFDRYAIDHYLRLRLRMKSNGAISKLTKILFDDLFPTPDYLYYLRIEPEEAYKRKKDQSFERLNRKFTIYEEIYRNRENKSPNFVSVDAS